MLNVALDSRFWTKVRKTRGCWFWTATKNNMGYGLFQFAINGKHGKRLAHRLSYAATNGPIPDGLCVLHKCDTPACVKPAHLFCGTKKDNYADMVAKGRRVIGWSNNLPPVIRGDDHWMRKHPERVPRGSEVGTAKLTEDDVRRIYTMRLKGLQRTVIARTIGIDQSVINDICHGTYWRHMLGTPGCPTLAELEAIQSPGTVSKLTVEQVKDIKRRLRNGKSIKTLGRQFGVAFQTISDIKRGKSWAKIA
jgi:hypothetical protein